jgi:hypothetical protein
MQRCGVSPVSDPITACDVTVMVRIGAACATDVVDAALVVCVSGHWVSSMIWDAARGVINGPNIHDAALNRVSWSGGVGISLALKSPALASY